MTDLDAIRERLDIRSASANPAAVAAFNAGRDAVLALLVPVGWIAVGGPDDGHMHDNSSCSCEALGASIQPVHRITEEDQ